jgi:hypothetical protein
MSIQRISGSRPRQALRLRPVPDKLRKYIELANVLPPGEDPPEMLPAQLPVQAVTDEQWQWVAATIGDLMARFPRFRDFMKGFDLEADPPVEAYHKAHSVRVARDVLGALARCDKGKLDNVNIPLGAYLESLVLGRADGRGRLVIERSPLLEALERVEIGRIRTCKRCRVIFWAGRLDMTCCSSPCTRAERQRRWREGFKEKYKVQRMGKEQADAQEHPSRVPSR